MFKVLRDNCITLSTKKAQFLRKEATILGFMIDAEGVRPDEAKVDSIRHFPVPQTAKDLRCFLGKINFIGKFIPNLQLTLATLNQAAHRPRNQFKLSPEALKAFPAACDLVADELKNYHPNWSRSFRLTTDASDYGMGGFLSQYDANGDERVIACFSEAFTGADLNWITRDKELYALLQGTRKFRYFLLGATLTWVTDHKPLLGKEKLLSAKI